LKNCFYGVSFSTKQTKFHGHNQYLSGNPIGDDTAIEFGKIVETHPKIKKIGISYLGTDKKLREKFAKINEKDEDHR